MIGKADFTRPPISRDPKQRLSPTLARGRARDAPHEHRAVPPIEVITITRVDVSGRYGFGRRVRISLPRVKFIEGPAS